MTSNDTNRDARTCERNTFGGWHVPRDASVPICRHCGVVIEGLARKVDGMGRAVDVVERDYADWLEAFKLEMARLMARDVAFTSEDITDRAGLYREPEQNSEPGKGNPAVGALMKAAASKGVIYRVGYAPSRNPRQHGALIAVWRARKASWPDQRS